MTDTQQGPRAVGSGPPPMKECERAQEFEEHEAHVWHKVRDVYKKYPLHCDGILPLAEQPPCQIFISPEKGDCGDPSPSTIRIRTQLIDAVIDVCKFHKHRYNHQSAARRQARDDQRKSA